ncbi:MAG: ATP-grasp domain-containing protein [Acidimicrobiia bacterium]|nr:ATP-grasp domain-containing protein [Acidimicrobiia bacterium]
MRSGPLSQGPPVIILGGYESALSIARSLGRRGVKVRALAKPEWYVCHSRYAECIPLDERREFWEAAEAFLLGSDSDHLAGSLILAGSDEALDILIRHRETLLEKFLLDRSDPVAQRKMLDKISTYHAAVEADVPVPAHWLIQSAEDLDAVVDDLRYPLLVKPRLSHLFWPLFDGAKHITATNFDELEPALEKVNNAGVDVFLTEKIPGPDDLDCSYYTYLDEDGTPRFDFTKRVIRRYPKNMGIATYNITDHVEGVKEPALRLLRHVGLQGLANVGFKLDERDGVLKLIECNARFTATTEESARAGMDQADIVYRMAVGMPLQNVDGFRDGVRQLDPGRDLLAFRELRDMGELSLAGWARSLAHPQVFSFFSLRDPGPTWSRRHQMLDRVRSRASKLVPKRPGR